MAVIPKIVCPPDDSIRCFRLIDPLSFGIVKGAATEVSIPTKGVCIPLDRYEDRRMVLQKNSTLKIDISGIASYGELKETFEFIVDLISTPDILAIGTQHQYSLYDSSLTLIESFTFDVVNSFAADLNSAVTNTEQIKNLVKFDMSDITNGSFTVAASTAGLKYRHVFEFDLTGSGGSVPYPYVHPGNLIQPYCKYPTGRVKIILIVPEFQKVDTATCGCSDPAGVMLSNTKYFQWAYESEYDRSQSTQTPILVSRDTSTSYSWSQNSTDHIGYSFVIGDLVNLQSEITKRALIDDIQGYIITTDTEIGDGSDGYLNHMWSPALKWKTAGEMNLWTGGQDVNDADRLYIETIYLKNTQDFNIPLRVLIGA